MSNKLSTKTSAVRHAVAKSTGATTWAHRISRADWKVECLNHGATTSAPNQSVAWVTSSHPQDWCPKCKAIAAGKAARVTTAKLDLPAPKPAPKPNAPKTPAPKVAAATPGPTQVAEA